MVQSNADARIRASYMSEMQMKVKLFNQEQAKYGTSFSFSLDPLACTDRAIINNK